MKIINFIMNVIIAGFAAMGGLFISAWLDSQILFFFIITPLIIWHFVDSVHNYRGD